MSVSKSAQIKITAKTDQAQQELAKLAGEAKRAEVSIGGIGKAGADASRGLSRIGDGASRGLAAYQTLAAGAVATAVGMDKAVMAGARYNAILQNLPFSIDAAREATKGFIGETALMDAALLAERAGLAKNSETFAQFAKDVQKVAMSRGQDASEAMDVLTRALSRNETELLDNYGIILKVQDAQKIMAERTGTTVSHMDAATKASAFMTVGLEKLHEVAEKSSTELDDFTASWMKFKAIITDVPYLVNSARDAIYDSLVTFEEFNKSLAGSLGLIDAELMRGGRGGGGALGRKLAAAQEKAMGEGLAAKAKPMQDAMMGWYDDQYNYGHELGKVTTKKLTQELESAWMDGIYGKKKSHKKKQDDVILIYDNFWETIQQEIHLKAAESQLMLDNVAARVASGATRTTDPFARDPKAALLADQELAAARRQIEINSASQKQEDLGVELELIGREEAAQLDHLAFLERTAESELELMDIKERKRAAMHDAQLSRIAVEVKAEQKRRAQMQMIGDAVSNVYGGMAAAAIQGALASGQSAKAAVRHYAGAKAQEMLIGGSTEAIQAIISLAMLDFPGAARHGAASGAAFAQAGVLAATYGVLGGFSGGTGPGNNLGAAFGNGDGGGFGVTPGSGRGSQSGVHVGEGPPISRPNAPPSPPRSQSGGRSSVINLNIHSTIPPTEEQLISLRRGLARSEREHPGVD